MKKGLILLIAVIVGVAGFWSVRHFNPPVGEQKEEISHYTCPMHPHIHAEKPGDCPICQMRLVPVYRDRRPQGSIEGEILISPEKQQLIGIKTAMVGKKEFIKTIRSPARATFDPDLAVAQAEFTAIARSVPSLRQSAIQRLRLFGMSDVEIKRLERRGEVDPALLLPIEGGAVWVYAPLYGTEREEVKEGTKVQVRSGNDLFDGTVRGIEPVADPMTRSVQARIEVREGGGRILPGSFLEAVFEIPVGDQLFVPKTAVLETGSRTLVFVIHDGTRFERREVKTGPESEEERVILEGLKEGETIATGAAFLVDSESQLKAAAQGTGGHSH